MEENDYYSMVVLIVAIVFCIYLVHRFFTKKHPPQKIVYRAKLLFFDEDVWYCRIDYGGYDGRGFVSLPEEGHFVGEEIDVEPEGKELLETFVLADSVNNP